MSESPNRPAVEFAPATSTASGFESNFSETPFDKFTSGGGDDDDGFGAFATGSVVIPSMDSLEDFDLNEDAREQSHSRPHFARTATADDGSALFGGLTSFSPPPLSPSSPRASPFGRHTSLSPPSSPSIQADLATSPSDPLGPSIRRDARLLEDGMVEATVDGGKVIRVPADEVGAFLSKNKQ